MIEINGLHKSFGKNLVLNNLDLQINQKGVFAILGPNGSGKSTLIKSILGLVIPDKGSISINGDQVINRSSYRSEIQYLPQIATFPGNLKVKELIHMIKDLRRVSARDNELVEIFNLGETLNKRLSALSGGTRQKVNILLCFMFDGALTILDEPTTGLDPRAIVALKQVLAREKEAGKTILITSHIMQFVEEVSDELVYLLEGKIYYRGTVEDLKVKTGKGDFESAIAEIAG